MQHHFHPTAIPSQVFQELQASLHELKLTPIVGKGEANEVYLVDRGDERFILRLHPGEETVRTYEKERWCIEQSTKVGVPNAECLAIGSGDGKAWMIQTALNAVDATDWRGDRLHVWRQLGKHAAAINSIVTTGFGWDLEDSESGNFGGTWGDVVQWSLNDLFEDGFFRRQLILTGQQEGAARARLEEMVDWTVQPRLSHGNLAPKNAMVAADGTVFVIDWGTAGSMPAPYQDLSDVMTWGWSIAEVSAFMEGYGISESDALQMNRCLQTLVLQRLLDSIKWAARRWNDWREIDFVRYSLRKLSDFV